MEVLNFPAIVRLLKTICEAVPPTVSESPEVTATVPDPAVNVPLLVRVPLELAKFIVLELPSTTPVMVTLPLNVCENVLASNVLVAPIVKAPPTVRAPPAVFVGVPPAEERVRFEYDGAEETVCATLELYVTVLPEDKLIVAFV